MALKSNLTFRKIEMVEAVALTGSVSAAAKILGLSQPALTQGLQSIELQLGVLLFTRGPRGLEPTPYVAPFLTHIQTMRDEIQAAKRELSGTDALPRRRLTVQTGPRAMELWVKPAIQALAEKNKDITIETVPIIRSIYENLLNRKVDLAIVPPSAIPKRDEFIFKPFAAVRNRILCRPDHPLISIRRPTFADLRNYPLCGDVVPPRYLTEFHGKLGQFATRDDATGQTVPAVQAIDLEDIFSQLETSEAVGFLPKELFSRLIPEGRLVLLDESDCRLPDLPVAIGYYRSRSKDPDIEQFIEELRSAELNYAHFFVDYDR